MKKLKLIIMSISLLFLSTQTNSQTLSEIINNPDLNFYEIQTQVNSNNKSAYNNADEKIQKRYDRWTTFWGKRVDKNGDFTAYAEAIYNYSQNFTSSGNDDNVWENLGPFEDLLVHANSSGIIYKHIGRAQSLWVNPTDTSEILIGTSNAGLWRTNNGGAEWNLLTKNMAFGVHGIQVDITNNIIY